MTPFRAILTLILRMHAWEDRLEPGTDWFDRAYNLGAAIEQFADPAEQPAMLAILEAESRASRASYMRRNYRSPWSLARCNAPTSDEWKLWGGTSTDAVNAATETAVGIYHRGLVACRGRIACAMSRYRGAKRVCKEDLRRAARTAWYAHWLVSLQGKEPC